jgi:hypothetical protein
MTRDAHIVYVQAGDRRKPWGAFHSSAAAAREVAKLRAIGLDARLARGRVLAGEIVLRSETAAR